MAPEAKARSRLEARRPAVVGERPVSRPTPLAAALALAFNAFVWGVSWWPFRHLEGQGLHPLWSTVLIFLLAAAAVLVARPHALGQVVRSPALWVLVLASGTTNAAFNWGVVTGDVVRVVLLFYLMPLWAVLLARWLLGERFTWLAGVRVVLALAGAAVVLWPQAPGARLQFNLADGLGLVGGLSFALNNVMLRREGQRSQESRALAMFIGGVVVAGGLAVVLAGAALIAWPPAPAASWLLPGLGLGVVFLLSNLALQYGAASLPANVTAVIMLTEVLFATASALWLGAGVLTPQVTVGGLLILLAALLATLGAASDH